MKKQIQYLIFTIIASTLVGYIGVFAATVPTQSTTKDTTSKQYYNNNASTNPLLNTAGQTAANKYPGGSQALKDLQKANGIEPDGLIGKDTAALLNNQKDSSSDGQPTGGTLNGSSDVNSPDTSSTDNILGISTNKLRKGDVDMNTIVLVILNIIQFLLKIAGTVAIFSLVYHAVKMQLNSGITGDSSGVEHAKKGMTGAIIGFIIAISAWFIVTRVVQLMIEVS